MTLPLPFTEDQRDCLQEISNVAMGAAGESLATLTGTFVELSIPVIRSIEPKEIPHALASLQDGEKVSAAVQAFGAEGQEAYALVVITEPSFNDLAVFAGRSVENDQIASELLIDLSQTLINTCIPHLMEQVGSEAQIDAPEVVALHVDLEDLRFYDIAGWDRVVSMEINYHLENHPFNCDLLLLYPDQAVEELCVVLDSLLHD